MNTSSFMMIIAAATACSGESTDLFAPLPPTGSGAVGATTTTAGSKGGAGGAAVAATGSSGAISSATGEGGSAPRSGSGGVADSGAPALEGGGAPPIDAAGTGGAEGGPFGTSACSGKSRMVTAADPFVSDFESGSLHGWYDFAATGALNDIAIVSPGAVGTLHAGHLAATNLPSFGAGMGFGTGCWDVSALDGVSFWAKGTAGADNVIQFQVAIPATHEIEVGGDCVERCNDHPSKKVALAPEWKQYVVRFSELAQAGFGAPAKYDGVMMALNWVSVSGPSVDFSVDEVALFSGTASSGPVGRGRDAGGPTQ
jgi:hypothetical protein